MNEEMQKKLLALLGKTESFAAETAPLVFRDLIIWAQIAWVLPMALLLALVGLLLIECKLMKGSEDLVAFSMFVTGLAIFLTALITIVSIADAFQATFAPYAFILGLLK